MCPLTQRNFHFPLDLQYILSSDGLHILISFLYGKWGMIKVQRQSFPFSLFIFTIRAHYLLSTVLAVIIIYIFE